MQPDELHADYDVVIVGAGPAGCSIARFLSDKFNILLIDKSEIPRDKPCGGLLVKESQHFIKQLEPLDFIFSKPKKTFLKLIDWDNENEVDVEREYVNVLRDKFDYWLLQLIEDKVDFSPKTEFLDFRKKGSHINVAIAFNGTTRIIKTKYLIGADGASSRIRRELTSKKVRSYIAIQESVEGDIGDKSYFIYDSKVTDWYSWIIPKGKMLVVGSALPLSNGNVRDKFDLLKKNINKKLSINGEYTKRESCLILRPSNEDEIYLGKDNILLAGEAAGLISPSTGEGISFALRSGYLCAHAINDMRDVYLQYEKLCKPLKEEIADKIIKSDALSDTEIRDKVLKEWGVLSSPNAHKMALELWSK